MNQLAAGTFGFANYLCQFRIVVVEDVAEQERGALLRGEALKDGDKRDRNLSGDLKLLFGRRKIVIGDGLQVRQREKFEFLALHLQVPETVEAQAGRDGYQKANW